MFWINLLAKNKKKSWTKITKDRIRLKALESYQNSENVWVNKIIRKTSPDLTHTHTGAKILVKLGVEKTKFRVQDLMSRMNHEAQTDCRMGPYSKLNNDLSTFYPNSQDFQVWLRILSWSKYLRLYWWAQYNPKRPYKRGIGGKGSKLMWR